MNNQIIGLAPMAGISDRPMRELCYQMGANYACTEMVSALGWMCSKASNEAYRLLLETGPEEYNTAVQLFGKDAIVIGEAAARACEERRFTSIDINMGCPARKVVSSGEGSALMLKPQLAERIMEAAIHNSSLPVTVKMRLGYDEDSRNALELTKAAEQLGLAHVCIHGRTRAQQYSGRANHEAIRDIKRQVRIPVLANGDITSADDALRVLAETGCDGLLIGRAAMGNPWLFRSIRQALAGKPIVAETLDERLALATEHIDRMVAFEGERLGVMEMRKHIGHYISGIRGASAMRRALNGADTADNLKQLLTTLFTSAKLEEAQ